DGLHAPRPCRRPRRSGGVLLIADRQGDPGVSLGVLELRAM
ncbi:MAG: hypothetical protein AVDCRST_MAG55-1382, partial [uncultured Rubrobacteraceae bacterium]